MEVFLKTLEQVLVMLFFMAAGYLLQRGKILPENSTKTVSLLLTDLILPAYVIYNLSTGVTKENIVEYGGYILIGLICLIVFLGIAYGLGFLLKGIYKDRKVLVYMLAFSNYSYFGYPLIEFVYGSETLAKVLIFVIPFTIFIYTLGIKMITSDIEKPNIEKPNDEQPNFEKPKKKFHIQPVIPALVLGILLGILGVNLTGKSENVALATLGTILSTAKSCMSPVSMIYTGMVLAKFSLKELSCSLKSAIVAFFRLVVIPAIVTGICYLLKITTGLVGVQYFLIPVVISAMPIGMNIVIFRGEDGAESAQVCFYSLIMGLATIPLLFTALQYLI